MILIAVAAGAAIHAYLFGRWLMKNGNRAGAFVVYLIAAACVGLQVYGYVAAP